MKLGKKPYYCYLKSKKQVENKVGNMPKASDTKALNSLCFLVSKKTP